jgi:DNA polymerase-3 subunit delta'
MSFADFAEQQQAIQLLQRPLARGRLGHAYLFSGARLGVLEDIARTLAKTLNCRGPNEGAERARPLIDCCDRCLGCRKTDSANHPDVQWVRPESKSRVITIDQVRDLIHTVQLKPAEAEYKVGVLVAADRLNVQAANAFLKTLEEPPPRSVLLLLSTEPQRMLETIQSRCLRLNFAGEGVQGFEPPQVEWVRSFSTMAAADPKGLLGRYRLLGNLLAKLSELKAGIEKALSASSPLERYDEVEADLKEKWQAELSAAVEAEYRRQRSDLLLGLQWWLRDVWLLTLSLGGPSLTFPELAEPSREVARRISATEAVENLRLMEQLQWLLGSNVQEALALEVGWLKLKF